MHKKNRVQGWAVPWIPVLAFAGYGTVNWQQNYPVHKIEMLAGIETMLWHVDVLQGTKFRWLTDHKGLTHLLNQKNPSGWQACWIEKISNFTFEVTYIAGSENVVADALSWIYSNDSAGTERAKSEYTYFDVDNDDTSRVELVGMEALPVLAGIEAQILTRWGSHTRQPSEKAAWAASEASSAAMPSPAVKGSSKDMAARV